MNNLLDNLPSDLSHEVFETLIEQSGVKIERIVSKGHTTPEGDWYDQEQNEWVVVIEGAAKIEYVDGRVLTLEKGDCVNIPAREKHRVSWTDPSKETIWLAVFY